MSDMNTIHVNDLVVDHPTASGPLRVLNCPELRIAGGTTTAITGRSGSGKSTLLGVLAGLGMPTKGSVTIGSTMPLSGGDAAAYQRTASANGPASDAAAAPPVPYNTTAPSA